mmetsp:Transcript_51211/g.111607  ORF Transcript_51211/g.111607 Transcript_51211/m.111607 type:complete len:215 (+) Transcript_51211:123-767(+)
MRMSSASSGVSSRTVARSGCTSPCLKIQTVSRSSKVSRFNSCTMPRALASTEYAAEDPRSCERVRRSLPALFSHFDQHSTSSLPMTSLRATISFCTTARKAFFCSSASSAGAMAGLLGVLLSLVGEASAVLPAPVSAVEAEAAAEAASSRGSTGFSAPRASAAARSRPGEAPSGFICCCLFRSSSVGTPSRSARHRSTSNAESSWEKRSRLRPM